MTFAALTVSLLISAGSVSAQPATSAPAAARFEPRLHIQTTAPLLYAVQPEIPRSSTARTFAIQHGKAGSSAKPPQTDIICGMTVIRKGLQLDPTIVVKPARRDGLAIRRITPPLCRGP